MGVDERGRDLRPTRSSHRAIHGGPDGHGVLEAFRRKHGIYAQAAEAVELFFLTSELGVYHDGQFGGSLAEVCDL